ncbi:MAG: hypothetical protein RKO66_00875 [Candidatus Contendobacter sp.]|nr:hypothetical protein [Candidatus Contendobacter sp.]MDS4060409.1 hypothetical protein [Candidatus Contendobacter sp.]
MIPLAAAGFEFGEQRLKAGAIFILGALDHILKPTHDQQMLDFGQGQQFAGLGVDRDIRPILAGAEI